MEIAQAPRLVGESKDDARNFGESETTDLLGMRKQKAQIGEERWQVRYSLIERDTI
jgi:hypothetical protein